MKLTVSPKDMTEEDLHGLRRAGWNDMEISGIVLVTAHFNYMNRVGLAFGVTPPGP